MSQLPEKTIAEGDNGRTQQQHAAVSATLDRLPDERRWDEAFARSQDELAKLVGEARAYIASGRVRNIGIDEL